MRTKPVAAGDNQPMVRLHGRVVYDKTTGKAHISMEETLQNPGNNGVITRITTYGTPHMFLGEARKRAHDIKKAMGCRGLNAANYSAPLYVEFENFDRTWDNFGTLKERYCRKMGIPPRQTKPAQEPNPLPVPAPQNAPAPPAPKQRRKRTPKDATDGPTKKRKRDPTGKVRDFGITARETVLPPPSSDATGPDASLTMADLQGTPPPPSAPAWSLVIDEARLEQAQDDLCKGLQHLGMLSRGSAPAVLPKALQGQGLPGDAVVTSSITSHGIMAGGIFKGDFEAAGAGQAELDYYDMNPTFADPYFLGPYPPPSQNAKTQDDPNPYGLAYPEKAIEMFHQSGSFLSIVPITSN